MTETLPPWHLHKFNGWDVGPDGILSCLGVGKFKIYDPKAEMPTQKFVQYRLLDGDRKIIQAIELVHTDTADTSQPFTSYPPKHETYLMV